MAKKKLPKEDQPISAPATVPARSQDRHKPRKMLALPLDVYAQLQALANQNDRPIAREARRIIIEALKKEGLWPPPQPEAD